MSNVVKEENVYYVERETKKHYYKKIYNKDFLDCFFFAWNMTFEGKGSHTNINERSTLKMFCDVLRGKMAEVYFYNKFKKALGLSKPDFNIYAHDEYDECDFKTSNNKKIDVKSLNSYSSMLFLNKNKMISAFEEENLKLHQDIYVLVKVIPDVFNYLQKKQFSNNRKASASELLKELSKVNFACSFSGFTTNQEVKEAIKNNCLISKGSYINCTDNKQIKSDLYYIHLNDIFPITKLKERIITKSFNR